MMSSLTMRNELDGYASELLAEQLAAEGWAVTESFLPASVVAALRAEAEALWQGGKFRQAAIGRGNDAGARPATRGDQILWLDERSLTAAQDAYWQAMDALRLVLNRTLFLGLQNLEAHFAVYPPATFYRKHVDRFADADERAISCSLYLNPDWQYDDGGVLRLYVGETPVEILPRAGTLAVFRSETMPHEVLPAVRTRFSLTGWFRRRSLRGILP